MNSQRAWCGLCNKLVEVGVQQVVRKGAMPLLLAGTAGAFGVSKRSLKHTVLWSLLAGGLGLAVQEFTPQLQRLVCGECGSNVDCSDRVS